MMMNKNYKTLCVFDCQLCYGHLFGSFLVPYSTPDKVNLCGAIYVGLTEENGKYSFIDLDNVLEFIRFHRISDEEVIRLEKLGLLNTGINPFDHFYLNDSEIKEEFGEHQLANCEEEEIIKRVDNEYVLEGFDGFLTYLNILDYLHS